MEDKILKVKDAVVDLLESNKDISDVTIFINENLNGDRQVTVSVDILAKLADKGSE